MQKTGTNLSRGLSTGEATQRLKVYGRNELDKEDPATLWERILEQFDDVLVKILLAAAFISYVVA